MRNIEIVIPGDRDCRHDELRSRDDGCLGEGDETLTSVRPCGDLSSLYVITIYYYFYSVLIKLQKSSYKMMNN